MKRLAGVALAIWAIHAINHVRLHSTMDLLWACNVAVLLVAIGAWLSRGAFVAVGVMWLVFGDPLWALDLLTGGELLWTSLLTHLGGLALGVVAVRELGWPKGAWRLATAGAAALLVITRLSTEPRANVNLAFRVHPGWESLFGSHAVYLALLTLGSALVFFVVETVARRMLGRAILPAS